MKFDVGVRLDIYQKTPPKPKDEQSSLQIAYNRRMRAPEIQKLKNDRVIGENRDGYAWICAGRRRRPPTTPTRRASLKTRMPTGLCFI